MPSFVLTREQLGVLLRRAGTALAVLGALVLVVLTPAGVSKAEASTSCDKVAGPSGSDTAPGTADRPYASARKLVDSLAGGETGCLRNGTYRENVDFRRGGREGDRLTLQSYPGERATIVGQVRVLENAHFVEVRDLDLDGSGAPRCVSPPEDCTVRPSPVVYGDDALFRDNDVTNYNTGICFIVGSSTIGTSYRTVVEHNRVHDCGRLPATNHDHGFYLENAYDTKIERNLIYDNVDRGIQFYPHAERTVVRHNVFDGNGQNVHFGRTSRGNTVENNVITNAKLRFNVESWEATGTGNVVRSNCINGARFAGAPSSSGVQSPQVGFQVSASVYADPLYRDRGAKDFRLRSNSPCADLFGNTEAGPRNEDDGQPEPPCDPVASTLAAIPRGDSHSELNAPEDEGDVDGAPTDDAREENSPGGQAEGETDSGETDVVPDEDEAANDAEGGGDDQTEGDDDTDPANEESRDDDSTDPEERSDRAGDRATTADEGAHDSEEGSRSGGDSGGSSESEGNAIETTDAESDEADDGAEHARAAAGTCDDAGGSSESPPGTDGGDDSGEISHGGDSGGGSASQGSSGGSSGGSGGGGSGGGGSGGGSGSGGGGSSGGGSGAGSPLPGPVTSAPPVVPPSVAPRARSPRPGYARCVRGGSRRASKASRRSIRRRCVRAARAARAGARDSATPRTNLP